MRRLFAPAAALAAVVGFVLVIVLVNARPAPEDGPVVAVPRASTTTPTATPTPSAPTTSATPAAPTATGAAAPKSTSAAAVAKAPLTVLNNSTESGLAARAAAQFGRGGWRVVKVGNFTGRVAVTTAYFAPGQEAAARALMAQYHGIQRVRPRFAGLPGSGLTVVVTRDYPA